MYRQLSMHVEEWATKIPFRITGHRFDAFKTLVVELSEGAHRGRGEGLPVFYLHETLESAFRQIEGAMEAIQKGITRQQLLKLLPPGAARNAVDCALWDLEAKRSGKTVWELAQITPRPVTTVFTIGIEDSPEMMAVRAREASIYPILKIKVDRDRPVERVAAIRAARPDATLVVDANQGWSFDRLAEAAPQFARMDVKLIEQPLPRGADESLEDYRSPVPLSADESFQHRGELDQAARRYQIINIKLDKVGGLTEALHVAREARARGLDVLVGNMGGTSLSMAPGFVLAQLCKYIELDGPLLLKYDRFPELACIDGKIAALDPRLWG